MLKSKEYNSKKRVRYLSEERLIYLTICRKKLGFTQEQVAELFNVTRASIISFETGRNERTDILFKYIMNFAPKGEQKDIIREYIEANLK